jgi:hypothetical protein
MTQLLHAGASLPVGEPVLAKWSQPEIVDCDKNASDIDSFVGALTDFFTQPDPTTS